MNPCMMVLAQLLNIRNTPRKTNPQDIMKWWFWKATLQVVFFQFPNTNQTDTAAQLVQTIKIFLAPEIRVQAGSKLTVTQNGVTTEYKSSGEPALYQTHQEIMLELFKGWA